MARAAVVAWVVVTWCLGSAEAFSRQAAGTSAQLRVHGQTTFVSRSPEPHQQPQLLTRMWSSVESGGDGAEKRNTNPGRSLLQELMRRLRGLLRRPPFAWLLKARTDVTGRPRKRFPPAFLYSGLISLMLLWQLARPTPVSQPIEVPFSDFLHIVDTKPDMLKDVRISPTRWDFTCDSGLETRARASAEARRARAAARANPPPQATEEQTTQAPSSSLASLPKRAVLSVTSTMRGKSASSAPAATSLPAPAPPQVFFTRPVPAPQNLVERLHQAEVPFRATRPKGSGAQLLLVAYIGVLIFLSRRMRNGMSGGSAGKRRSDELRQTSFDEVAGIDVAKREVAEIVDMLKSPSRYATVGARIPSGVLLVGPPGTGKTMLARAMASESQVPFFYCSGSEFMELFVGVGASRVRKIFEKAKKAAPCILFIDELDALGRSRSMGSFAMKDNSESDQTLNQLLTCMDGIDTSNNGVIVIAATNRVSVLDDALLRPGRFDRVVNVPLPDEKGRAEIVRAQTRKIRLEDPASTIPVVAKLTNGKSGAELAGLVNEAAIRTARRGGEALSTDDFLDAIRTSEDARSKAGGKFPFGLT